MSNPSLTKSAPDDSVGKVATLWAGPGEASNSTSSVDDNVAYRFVLDNKVQTISSNSIPESGLVAGLLFVPSLDLKDPCHNTTAPFVPSNVTRYEDVSTFGYSLIGLAPWVSAECSRSFLSAGKQVGTHAMIFYEPSNNDTGLPPDSNDSRWTIDDGEEWRIDNDYPVYAIPGPAGTALIRDLSTFPGTSSHNKKENLTKRSESERLFVKVEIGKETGNMPSIWSFVLAIVGTVLVLGLLLVVMYRLLLRRRRDQFQRSLGVGQVDVEALTLNQIKAPWDVVDKMPLYTYIMVETPPKASVHQNMPNSVTDHESSDRDNTTPPAAKEDDQFQDDPSLKDAMPQKPERAMIHPEKHAPDDNPRSEYRLSHTQTTCAICLDDFVAGSSTVRELPCGHIFDSECIDQFLTENSCLCPLCKKCVLPAGSYYISMAM